MTEREVPAGYDPRDYPPVAVSADVVPLTIRDGKLAVLLIKRSKPPFENWWALPGSFVKPDERTHEAAVRGVSAKANVAITHIEQLKTYDKPDRDPRMRVISVAYLSFAPIRDEPSPGYHAEDAKWFPVFEQLPDLAFDHLFILRDGIQRAQDKLEYTTLATSLLPPLFTRAALQRVYEAVWNQPIDKANFYRKLASTKDFLVPYGGTERVPTFLPGKAKTLYPPIRRERGAW